MNVILYLGQPCGCFDASIIFWNRAGKLGFPIEFSPWAWKIAHIPLCVISGIEQFKALGIKPKLCKRWGDCCGNQNQKCIQYME